VSEDQSLGLIWGVGALILVASALFARRVSFGETIRNILVWIVIFLVVLIVFSFRGEFEAVYERVRTEVLGERTQEISGTSLRIRQSQDGHFWVSSKANGKNVELLIDSGATTTAISSDTAAYIAADVSNSFPVQINTANGTVTAYRGRIDRLEVGPLVALDHAIITSKAFGKNNVLGMNFLSQLKSWRVEGDIMILEP